jgi:cytochrome oxidase Cu insertion factor (SCO1/SenC/PrrC family)
MNRKSVILSAVILLIGFAAGFGGAMGLNRGGIRNAKLKVGDPAPEFDLYDSTGAKLRLSDFRGQKNIVLAFYPAAWTPV